MSRPLRFAGFELDRVARTLRRDGETLPLGARAGAIAAISQMLVEADEQERLEGLYRARVLIALENQRESDPAMATCRAAFEYGLKQAAPHTRRLYVVGVTLLRATRSWLEAADAISVAFVQYGGRERVPRSDPRVFAMQEVGIQRELAEDDAQRAREAYKAFKDVQARALAQMLKSSASGAAGAQR